MHPFLKAILRFIGCTIIIYGISYFTLPLAIRDVAPAMASKAISSIATAIFMLFNFPLWIMGKGAEIFKLDPNLVRLELLLDAAFYGLIFAAWFSNTRKQPKPPVRRGVE